MSQKPTLKIKPFSRFREYRAQQQNERLNEDWSQAFLIDEIYIQLMSIKYRDSEGILRRAAMIAVVIDTRTTGSLHRCFLDLSSDKLV